MATFTTSVYIERRKKLKEMLGHGQVLLFGNKESGINFKDNWYPFRQDSTLLYYTGIDQPDVHLIMDIDSGKDILYGNELSIDDIIWTGPLPSLREVVADVGLDQVKPLSALSPDVHPSVKYLPPYRPEHRILLAELLGKPVNEVDKSASYDLIMAVISQRNIKEESEVLEMQKAVNYSYEMHRAVILGTRPKIFEHQLVGIAAQVAHQHNVTFAYPAILTKRGEVLHNHDHHGQLESGDMVLYDGGCESRSHYAGDITRTFR